VCLKTTAGELGTQGDNLYCEVSRGEKGSESSFLQVFDTYSESPL
jgi:hypothetical protein